MPLNPTAAHLAVSTSASSIPETHVLALDGVRGLAILLVLLFHYPAPFAWVRPLTSIGWCGVDLFFVLSGYLITGILYSSSKKPHYFRDFYVRRSLRIFPLYYGFLLVVVVVLPRFVDPYFLGLENLKRGTLLEFWLYYSNYSNVFTGWLPLSLGALWSLAVEEHFYLFWPMFIKITPKQKLIRWCAVLAFVVLLNRLAIGFFKITWLAAYYLTTSRADALVIGAMTAILARQNPNFLKRWMAPTGSTMAVILLSMGIWRGGLSYNDWPVRTLGYSVLAVLFASIVWVAGTSRGPVSQFLANRVLVTLGKYSYCLYIVHVLVLTVCERWLAPRFFPPLGWSDKAPLPLFIVSLSFTFVIAFLSWRFYESPCLSLKARFSYREPLPATLRLDGTPSLMTERP